MVLRAVKPSFLPASCCNVEVMNGGAGFRRRSPRVTDLTTNRAPSSEAIRARVVSSLPSDAFSPATSFKVATNSGGRAALSRAWSDQYSTGRNALISRSRSTISRTVTDCTRPAERPRWTFSQSKGDRL